MYLRKVEGARSVTLPDGSVLSRADLPAPDTKRWVASRKALIVKALKHDLIQRDEALERYGLSDEELECWERDLERQGQRGLMVSARRRPKESIQ